MARKHDRLRKYPSRPFTLDGSDTIQTFAWDMADCWLTTAEWLAWVRRRDGGPTRWNGKRWVYPVRPMIRLEPK